MESPGNENPSKDTIEQAKYPTELLLPTQKETVLWKRLDEADFPTRTILKRLNRIVNKKFPKYKLQTSSSCSGHIKEDGSMGSEHNDYNYNHAHIMFDTRSKKYLPEMSSYLKAIFNQAVNRTNEKLQDNVINIKEDANPDFVVSRSYFNGAYYSLPPKLLVRHYPELSPEKVGNHPLINTYTISYDFPILRQKDGFPVLDQFWKSLGQVLTTIDGLNIPTSFKKEDFLRPEVRSKTL